MKPLAVISMLGCLAIGTAYLTAGPVDPRAKERPAAVMGAQEEIANQIRRTKDSLYQAASEYINQMEHLNNAILQHRAEFQAREWFCPSSEAATRQACPPPALHLDWVAHIGAIEKAAAQLEVAVAQFKVEVSEIHYRACQQYGYLCRARQDPRSFDLMWRDLPATDLDHTIRQALDGLPYTRTRVNTLLETLAAR